MSALPLLVARCKAVSPVCARRRDRSTIRDCRSDGSGGRTCGHREQAAHHRILVTRRITALPQQFFQRRDVARLHGRVSLLWLRSLLPSEHPHGCSTFSAGGPFRAARPAGLRGVTALWPAAECLPRQPCRSRREPLKLYLASPPTVAEATSPPPRLNHRRLSLRLPSDAPRRQASKHGEGGGRKGER